MPGTRDMKVRKVWQEKHVCYFISPLEIGGKGAETGGMRGRKQKKSLDFSHFSPGIDTDIGIHPATLELQNALPWLSWANSLHCTYKNVYREVTISNSRNDASEQTISP